MSPTTASVLVGALAMLGTLGGAYLANRRSSALIAYRLQELEKKVDKHNGFAEKIPVLEEKLSVANNRIADLERQVEHLMAPGT